jgi:hypothetical protein
MALKTIALILVYTTVPFQYNAWEGGQEEELEPCIAICHRQEYRLGKGGVLKKNRLIV